MMKRNALVALLLAIMMIFGVAVSGCKSCDDDDGQQNQQQPDPSNPIEPEKPEGEKDSIILNVGTLDLYIGESQTLVATVLPETADKTVIWTSDKTTVATVVDGKVTAVALGTAIITAKSSTNKTAVCTVNVKERSVSSDSITLNKNTLSLLVGENETLIATVLPSTADQKVEWTSNNNSVAIVLDGKVTAVAKGTAIITVKSAVNQTATCVVTVSEKQVRIFLL